MITKVYARNYRSLGDVEVELGRLTVLVGQNGSGKSNFVDVLHFLADALSHGLDTAVANRHGIGSIPRWPPRRPYDVALRIGFREVPVSFHTASGDAQGDGEYGLEIKSVRQGQYEVKREHLSIAAGDELEHFEVARGEVIECSHESLVGNAVPRTSLLAPAFPALPSVDFVRNVASFGFYSIFPNVLGEPQKPSAEWPLDSHGSNLSSVLRGMREADSEFLPEVTAALGQLVPGIRDVKVSQVGGYLALKLLHDGGDGPGHWFDASQESDGTLRVLGVLTALYQDPAPGLVAIEEPELTVHPGMLPLLRDCIQEAAAKRTQVIITTHSPDLMSLFDVDALRVVEMTESGTQIGPVADWQRQAIRDELFSPGDIARAEGLQIAGPAE